MGVIVVIVRVPMMPMHGDHLAGNRRNSKAALTLRRTQF
jgi:hypothetical protein